MKKIFIGSVNAGKLSLNDPASFKATYQSLQGPVELTIGRPKRNRTSEQNKYYWGVVIKILSECLGYTDEEMHEALKFQFLRIREDKLPTVRSTSDLTTTEFNEFIEKVKILAAELNIYIPEPNEVEV